MDEPYLASVLVVDDNEQNRALARGCLADEGYRVLLAADGVSALRAFEAEVVDCVLLDVRMPAMDGFAVCRALRALPRGNDASIVFLTALRDIDTFEAAQGAGGDDFLTKPLNPSELVARVRTALQLRRTDAENRDLVETIRAQRDAMLRLQLQNEQLTAYLVHDLKNPLNALDMHAQLLLRNKDLPQSTRTSVQAIRHEASRLTQLIGNMLDISRGEAGALTLNVADVSLLEIVDAVAREFQIVARGKALSWRQEVHADRIRADPGLLRRVLENLVNNAARYAPQGSSVSVSSRRSAEGTTIMVSDQGRGVPDEIKRTIFDRFVQAETGRRSGGHGLGLAFCKLVVEAHGGSIRVEDGAPGAVFCVSLPS